MPAQALAATGASAEFAHARSCLIAILSAGGGPAYAKLVPVLRALLHQPHAVVQANVDALLRTGSGAAFIEALTAPPVEGAD